MILTTFRVPRPASVCLHCQGRLLVVSGHLLGCAKLGDCVGVIMAKALNRVADRQRRIPP